jgi:glycosyltransferase involved in cell wall biosynthesis
MRVGQNPIKSVESVAPPSPVTVVVISYIPFLRGYYAQGLDILNLCLDSLLANTDGDYDLLVFDNGSCKDVRDYLLAEQGKNNIQFLLLSEHNIGKPAAWNFALAASPGKYIAYADSDVIFYPGWLSASLKTLKDFPKAGMVTAMPILTPNKFSTATSKWAMKQRGLKVEKGHLLPWEDFWRHARSLGDSEEKARSFYYDNKIIRIDIKARRYFAGAAHFQFTAPKAALLNVLPIPAERPMGQVRLLDQAMDDAGYLRLCTDRWYVQHLGNQMPQPSDLVASLNVERADRKQNGRRSGIWGWPPLRKFLQWLYGWSFDRLHRSE